MQQTLDKALPNQPETKQAHMNSKYYRPRTFLRIPSGNVNEHEASRFFTRLPVFSNMSFISPWQNETLVNKPAEHQD